MKTGIVILNYNTYDLTCELVKNCVKMHVIDKVVIVDNCSNDNFDEFVNKINSKKIKYIKNKDNSGYASGNNIGLKFLKSEGYDFAFVANPDVWFEENVIENILKVLDNNKDFGVASCTRTLNGTKNTGQYWWIPTFISALFESLYIVRKIQNRKCVKETCRKCLEFNGEFMVVEVVGGAFFGCNLKIMDEIGYLDEDTFLWYEENILAYKLREKKYKVALLSSYEYEHNHQKNKKSNNKFHIFLESKRHYCYKYLKINKFQKVLLYIFDNIGKLEQKLISLLR